MDKITKELTKHKERELKEMSEHAAVKDAQKLLDYESGQDREMLKAMGLGKQIRIAEDVRGKQMELENLDTKFSGNVFHIDTIKKLCLDYRLRFLNSQRYSGTIDTQLPARIKEFATLNDIELNHTTLEYKFYILAPSECFDLKDVVRDKDPALFYKVDEQHYRLVHKWGSDFTILRALIGWRWKNYAGFVTTSWLIGAVVASILCPLLFPLIGYAEGWYWVVWFAFTIGSSLIALHQNASDCVVEQGNLTESCWFSEKRYR